MSKTLMSREQAAAIVGNDLIARVERLNCEPTNRVGFNGASQGDEATEWSASVTDGDTTLRAYYYTTNEQDAAMAAADGDGSAIDWEVAGFEVV